LFFSTRILGLTGKTSTRAQYPDCSATEENQRSRHRAVHGFRRQYRFRTPLRSSGGVGCGRCVGLGFRGRQLCCTQMHDDGTSGAAAKPIVRHISGRDLFAFVLPFEAVNHSGCHSDAVLNEFLVIFAPDGLDASRNCSGDSRGCLSYNSHNTADDCRHNENI